MVDDERRRMIRWAIGGLGLLAALTLLWVTTPAYGGPIGLRTRAGLVIAFVLVPTAVAGYLLGHYGKGRVGPWVVTILLAIAIHWWMLLLFFTRSFACGAGAGVCGSPHSARVIGILTALFVWVVTVGAEAKGLEHRDRLKRTSSSVEPVDAGAV